MNQRVLKSMKRTIPILFLIFLGLITHKSLIAQESDTPSAIIESFFNGMRASDGDYLRALITEDATLHTVTQREGETVKEATDISRFIDLVSSSTEGVLDERLMSLKVYKDGNLATAWMEYTFFRGNEFSHCGVNSMNLMHTSEGWKIFSIVDTRRTDNCD